MSLYSIDIKNESKRYLDEKELFILYSLVEKKHISTMYSNVFIPNGNHIHVHDDVEDKVKAFEKEATEVYEGLISKKQTPVILDYLLNLGKELDEKGFSIYCNADYSLVEGGFLSDYVGKIMYEYLYDTNENRKNAKKYKTLNKEQIDFLSKAVKNEDFDGIISSRLEHPPVKEYQEAILNKNADEDFIELVNKLVTDYEGGRWNTEDVEKFLEIYYRHNKEKFRKNATTEKTFMHEDYQTKLARLILEHVDIHLAIKNTDKLEKYLSEYINLFINDELNGISRFGLTRSFFSTTLSKPLHTKLFGFKKAERYTVEAH